MNMDERLESIRQDERDRYATPAAAERTPEEYEALSELPMETNEAGDIYLTREPPRVHETYCTSVLDEHEGECPGKPEDSPEMTAFREAVAKQRPVLSTPQIEVNPHVFEKWHSEEGTLKDGTEATLSTAEVAPDYREKFPTAEVTLENPDGTRITVLIECPNEQYSLNSAAMDAAIAAQQLMRVATDKKDSKAWKKE